MENGIKKRVCVVGAGAGGLVAIRHIKQSGTLTGTVFESAAELGGIWKFDASTPTYKGLNTNLPRQIMGYLDLPFNPPSSTPIRSSSFLSHTHVLEYLNSYADKFQLRDSIRFNTRVLHIQPHFAQGFDDQTFCKEYSSNLVKWDVTYELRSDETGCKTVTEVFDAVAICNGKFDKPLIPKPNLLNKFKGELLHSKDYKIPEPFTNKRVLIYGSGPSGIDIMLEVVNFASEITLSHRKPPHPGLLPEKISQRPLIKNVQGTQVTFEDESFANFDVILICTGYEYDLPFVGPESGLVIEGGKFISPLYRHMININYPSMALIGLPFRNCPFMLMDCQVRYFVTLLEGKGIRDLPSKQEMLLDLESEKKYRSINEIPFDKSHQLEELQWDYMKVLGDDSGFSNLLHEILPVTKRIYDWVANRRKHFPSLYRFDEITDNECNDHD